MEGVAEAQPQRLRIDRVLRSMQVTDVGRVVISFESQGASFELEMSQDHAADLSDGLARALRVLASRRA